MKKTILIVALISLTVGCSFIRPPKKLEGTWWRMCVGQNKHIPVGSDFLIVRKPVGEYFFTYVKEGVEIEVPVEITKSKISFTLPYYSDRGEEIGKLAFRGIVTKKLIFGKISTRFLGLGKIALEFILVQVRHAFVMVRLKDEYVRILKEEKKQVASRRIEWQDK